MPRYEPMSFSFLLLAPVLIGKSVDVAESLLLIAWGCGNHDNTAYVHAAVIMTILVCLAN